MKRLSVAAAVPALLLLAACASEPPMMSDKRPATPPGGLWEVTEAVAAEPMREAVPSPYLGQRMALFGQAAGDPAGRLCKSPVYQGYEAPPALVLGIKGAEERRPVLEVICDGEVFGTYVGAADGKLRTRVNAWLLTLARAPETDTHAADHHAPAPAPQAIAIAPPPAPPPPAPPPAAKAAGPLVYLASYKNPETARIGFERLSKHSAILAASPMVLKDVDLGAKGKWVRLFAQAPDAAQGKALCDQLGKHVNGCGGSWAK